MLKRILDLRLFRYALTSAEQGSFRRAAASLNLQQSTVSRGVRSLEYRVGADLFERGHAGIRPTAAGQRFLEEAALGFEHLERAVRRAGALQRAENGVLTVSVSVPLMWLGNVFERFRDEYGGISLEITEGTSSASWAQVEQRKVDVAFATKSHRHGAPRSLHLRDERMVVAVPKSHPFASARRLRLEELQDEVFILGVGGLGPDIEGYLVRRMAKWSVTPNIQRQQVGPCDLVDMVARGYGATIVVGPLPYSAPPGVALIPLVGKNIMPLHAFWMESNPNPALEGLLKIIRRSGSFDTTA